MKKFKTIMIRVLACVLVMVVGIISVLSQGAFPSETNAFVSDYYIGATNQNKPFFEKELPEIAKNIKENNKHSVTPYYDAFPLANNPKNFQGLGSTTYANINGQTVTAEAFMRVYGDSLHDPNVGMGLLIYQCIQYKIAHPEEKVKLTYSSYRTAAEASVCVIPESKYYGYMRSLYGTNYDEQGFVRISYMLTEAARMGIEVIMVNQHTAYKVKQYNPKTKALKDRITLNYKTYFAKALETECYNKYEPGKKVSDFFTFCTVDWKMTDKLSDAQHMKSCTASHYLATDGTEHKNAVFLTSSNLDENDYLGRNGNGLAQSGVLVSDHEGLYRATYNYTKLMNEYKGKEELYLLQKVMNDRNKTQIQMFLDGKGDQIPEDEQIVYIGGENDPVFELYFTPFGGGLDVWDTENNPYCKYIDKFAKSEGYVEFAFNIYEFSPTGLIASTVEKMVEEAFIKNQNSRNKIFLRVPDFNSTAIRGLKIGTQIGAVDINYKDTGINDKYHTKDLLMSYAENGVRHRVSLIGSGNFYPTAFSLRTNSLLVINETDATGGNYYSIYGNKFTNGMIKETLNVNSKDVNLTVGHTKALDVEYSGNGTVSYTSSDSNIVSVDNGILYAHSAGKTIVTVTDGSARKNILVTVTECKDCKKADEGLTFNINEQYTFSEKLTSTPCTFEAVFSVKNSDLTKKTNTLLGSDGSYDPALVYYLNASGNPAVMVRKTTSTSKQDTYVFNKVNVATGKTVHLSITMDFSNKKINCYVNGSLVQSLTMAATSSFKEKHNMVIGGDHLNGNATFFPGVIKSIALWSDVRSASEISSDYKNGISYADKNLQVAYDLTLCDNCMIKDLSCNNLDLDHILLWQSKSSVEEPTDYAYSFAIVGDTQTMCENNPEAMESVYDWILKNQKSKKIAYVIGLGDITDDSTDREWDDASNYISKLDNKIPYSLCRGNHDDWDDFNRILHNGYYETTIDGMMVSGDVELTDPGQPGLLEKTVNGVKGIYTRQNDIPEGGTVQGDLTNSYRYLTVAGTDYLIITLDFAPNEKMLEWLESVLAAHPNHKVIITTHAYMYRDGTTLDAKDLYPPSNYLGYTNAQDGDDMWEKCISKYENVLMVLSGHDPWQHIVYRQDKGINGNTVTQMLIDAQYVDLNIGATAMIAMFYFSEDGNTLTVRYYSVEKDCYGSELSQFTISLK